MAMFDPLPHGKAALLFSGGMDSFMLLKLLRPTVAVRVSIGSRYDQVEANRVERMVQRGYLGDTKLVVENRVQLADLERPDGIVPLRNLYFVALASYWGDVVVMGAMHGDNSRDKDDTFFGAASGLLTYLAQDPHNATPHRAVKVVAPAKHLTKTELLGLYLAAGHSADELGLSISCYAGRDAACGNCKPCFRRWVAFALNGLPHAEVYQHQPWATETAARAAQAAKTGHRGREDGETLAALRLMRVEV